MPALCNILVAGETGVPPVALGDVLKAVYAVIAAESDSATATSELFASGGIHSLVRSQPFSYHTTRVVLGSWVMTINPGLYSHL